MQSLSVRKTMSLCSLTCRSSRKRPCVLQLLPVGVGLVLRILPTTLKRGTYRSFTLTSAKRQRTGVALTTTSRSNLCLKMHCTRLKLHLKLHSKLHSELALELALATALQQVAKKCVNNEKPLKEAPKRGPTSTKIRCQGRLRARSTK
jgi:hypothetical protein